MSDLSRRRFLQAATAAVAAASAGPARLERLVATSPASAPAGGLVRSTFVPLVGSTFGISHAGGHVAVVLAGVEDLRAGGDPEGCFSLSFTGPPGPVLPQGVYPVAGGPGVRHDVLVVPVDRAAVRTHYEVVVNSPTDRS
jgi:hypothetical protein